jgi:hypothetical protein
MTSFFRRLATLAVAAALPCIAGAAADGKADDLLVFVGQKISLAEQPPSRCDNCTIIDMQYAATYRILDTVCGNEAKKEAALTARGIFKQENR